MVQPEPVGGVLGLSRLFEQMLQPGEIQFRGVPRGRLGRGGVERDARVADLQDLLRRAQWDEIARHRAFHESFQFEATERFPHR